MTKRRLAWLASALVVLAVLAVLVPASPVYLLKLNYFNRSQGETYDGRSTRDWVQALSDPSPDVRQKAAFALGHIGTQGGRESVPALARVLREERDKNVRSEAALALSKVASPSAERAPALTQALREAVPTLARALEDEDPWVRMNAATALFQLKREARPAVPALIQALKNKDNRTNLGRFHFTIQERVALALGRASAGTAEGVPALLELLEGADTPELREFTARALGEVGPEARPAVPELTDLLNDRRDRTALGASTVGLLESPWGSGPLLLASALHPGRGSRSEEVKQAAARALGEIGPDARPAVPRLKDLLREKSQETQKAAREALDKIEKKPADAS